MSKYDVFIYGAETYKQIEASSEEEAKRIALERWAQRIPSIMVFENEMDVDAENDSDSDCNREEGRVIQSLFSYLYVKRIK